MQKKMVENSPSPVYKNGLAGTGCERLYLEARTSDIFFIFAISADESVKLPAHKCILSAISSVFDAMFYGPARDLNNIKIVDSSIEAFKEFLQFFYLTKVTLTAENVVEVLNLGKQYMVDDCLNACTEYLKTTLTSDNLCWGYELAILFEMDALKLFCEQKIRQTPKAVFKTHQFLNCEFNLLRQILRLNWLACSESAVFDGCMAWAKVACAKNGVKSNKADNLRSQLGELFYEIRFGEFTHKQLHDRFQMYGGLFSLDEFKDISMMIENAEFRSGKFNRSARSVKSVSAQDDAVCDRKGSSSIWYNLKRCEHSDLYVDKTIFQSNRLMQLNKFTCSVTFDGDCAVAKTKLSQICTDDHDDLIFFANVSFSSSIETDITLSSCVFIKPGVRYKVEFEFQPESGHSYTSELVRNEVEMDNEIVMEFSGQQLGMQSIVKALHFLRCDS